MSSPKECCTGGGEYVERDACDGPHARGVEADTQDFAARADGYQAKPAEHGEYSAGVVDHRVAQRGGRVESILTEVLGAVQEAGPEALVTSFAGHLGGTARLACSVAWAHKLSAADRSASYWAERMLIRAAASFAADAAPFAAERALSAATWAVGECGLAAACTSASVDAWLASVATCWARCAASWAPVNARAVALVAATASLARRADRWAASRLAEYARSPMAPLARAAAVPA